MYALVFPFVALFFLGLAASPEAGAQASKPRDLETRLARVERLVSSQSLVEMLSRLERLQNEVQQLRGEVEVLNYNLEGLKQRQRDLYRDIDRRLGQLERGGGTASSVPAVPPMGSPSSSRAEPAARTDAPRASSGMDASRESAAYQAAFDRLKEGQYDQASQAFKQFLQDYPGGSFADNAQYWLGEASYVTRDFPNALAEFGKIVQDYPESPKVPDAQLKIGYIHYESGDWKKARDILTEVSKSYANNTAGRLAAQRLERMKQEGH